MKRFIIVLALFLTSPALADGFGFRTPTGNIYCNGSIEGGAELWCVIVNREAGSAPPVVGYCPPGREFEVRLQERGVPAGQCGRASGGLSRYTDVADYGRTANFGAIFCRSERTGFTCSNLDGHGFFLSRRSQQIF